MKELSCDVLVIGAGETGIRAAVEAKRCGAEKVILANKGALGTTGVMFSELTYGWDMQAATGENDPTDSKDIHLSDILNAAQGTASAELASIVVNESSDRLADLQDLFGLELATWEGSSKPRQVYGCFSTKNRAYQFVDPRRIKASMADSVKRYGITLLENTLIASLVVHEGRCIGAVGVDRGNELYLISAGATVLSAGGATGIFKHSFASPGMYGDGYALGLRAGCRLANMEFMQFGLGVLEPRYRALFLDRLMYLEPRIGFTMDHAFPRPLKELLAEHSKHFPFSCIDDSFNVDVAIFKETLANGGEGVPVDISHIPTEELEKIPVYRLWRGWFGPDLDPHENTLRVTTFAHACNGGIMINADAATDVPGLYAAGEMASGPHGANRLGGNMHAVCQVFGARAGRKAGSYAAAAGSRTDIKPFCTLPSGKSRGHEFYAGIKQELGDLLWENVNVLRNEVGLTKTLSRAKELCVRLSEIDPSPEEYWDHSEASSAALTAWAIAGAALSRTESRGSHYREDHPATDPKPYVVKIKLNGKELDFVNTERYDD